MAAHSIPIPAALVLQVERHVVRQRVDPLDMPRGQGAVRAARHDRRIAQHPRPDRRGQRPQPADLQAGRVDAALAATSYFVSTLSKPGGDKLVLAGPLFTGGLLGRGTGIGIRKADPELKVMFDRAINEAIADGTVRKLSVQWFKTDISPPPPSS